MQVVANALRCMVHHCALPKIACSRQMAEETASICQLHQINTSPSAHQWKTLALLGC